MGFTLGKSCLQRMKVSGLLQISWPIPASWERDPNCLASLLSGSTPLATISQYWRSQVSWGSPRDRDQVIISGPVSSTGFEDPVSFPPLPTRMDLVLDFFFLTEATATGMGCCSGSTAASVAMVLVGLLSFPSPEGAVQSQCVVGRTQHIPMPVSNCHSNFLSNILPFYQGCLYLFRGELPNHWRRILLQNLDHFLSSFMLLKTIHLWGWFLSNFPSF